jgi:hypothetical protein
MKEEHPNWSENHAEETRIYIFPNYIHNRTARHSPPDTIKSLKNKPRRIIMILNGGEEIDNTNRRSIEEQKINAFISTEKRRKEDRESIKTEPEARRRTKEDQI